MKLETHGKPHMPAMRILFILLSLGVSRGMKGIKKVNHPTLEQVSHEFANICSFFEIEYIIAPIRFIPLHRATFDTFVEKFPKKQFHRIMITFRVPSLRKPQKNVFESLQTSLRKVFLMISGWWFGT
jgi:hypothetical protein